MMMMMMMPCSSQGMLLVLLAGWLCTSPIQGDTVPTTLDVTQGATDVSVVAPSAVLLLSDLLTVIVRCDLGRLSLERGEGGVVVRGDATRDLDLSATSPNILNNALANGLLRYAAPVVGEADAVTFYDGNNETLARVDVRIVGVAAPTVALLNNTISAVYGEELPLSGFIVVEDVSGDHRLIVKAERGSLLLHQGWRSSVKVASSEIPLLRYRAPLDGHDVISVDAKSILVRLSKPPAPAPFLQSEEAYELRGRSFSLGSLDMKIIADSEALLRVYVEVDVGELTLESAVQIISTKPLEYAALGAKAIAAFADVVFTPPGNTEGTAVLTIRLDDIEFNVTLDYRPSSAAALEPRLRVNSKLLATNEDEAVGLLEAGLAIRNAGGKLYETKLRFARGSLTLLDDSLKDHFDGEDRVRGNASVSQRVFASLLYTPLPDWHGVDFLEAELDGEEAQNTELAIAVRSVDDPPRLRCPPTISVAQAAGTARTLQGWSVEDIEAAQTRLTLSARLGRLELEPAAGVLLVVNDGTIHLSGASAGLQTTLDRLSYTAPASYTGQDDVLTLTATDASVECALLLLPEPEKPPYAAFMTTSGRSMGVIEEDSGPTFLLKGLLDLEGLPESLGLTLEINASMGFSLTADMIEESEQLEFTERSQSSFKVRATLQRARQLIRNLQFAPPPDFHGPAKISLQLAFKKQQQESMEFHLEVTPVTDAPRLKLTRSRVQANATVFVAEAFGLVVQDVDLLDLPVMLTLRATNGTLQLSKAAMEGVDSSSTSTDNDDSMLLLFASPARLNAALKRLTFDLLETAGQVQVDLAGQTLQLLDLWREKSPESTEVELRGAEETLLFLEEATSVIYPLPRVELVLKSGGAPLITCTLNATGATITMNKHDKLRVVSSSPWMLVFEATPEDASAALRLATVALDLDEGCASSSSSSLSLSVHGGLRHDLRLALRPEANSAPRLFLQGSRVLLEDEDEFCAHGDAHLTVTVSGGVNNSTTTLVGTPTQLNLILVVKGAGKVTLTARDRLGGQSSLTVDMSIEDIVKEAIGGLLALSSKALEMPEDGKLALSSAFAWAENYDPSTAARLVADRQGSFEGPALLLAGSSLEGVFYVPPKDFHGLVTVRALLLMGSSSSSSEENETARVVVRVLAVNDAPVLNCSLRSEEVTQGSSLGLACTVEDDGLVTVSVNDEWRYTGSAEACGEALSRRLYEQPGSSSGVKLLRVSAVDEHGARADLVLPFTVVKKQESSSHGVIIKATASSLRLEEDGDLVPLPLLTVGSDVSKMIRLECDECHFFLDESSSSNNKTLLLRGSELPAVRYRPRADYNGPDEVRCFLESEELVDVARLAVRVSPVSDAPRLRLSPLPFDGERLYVTVEELADADDDVLELVVSRGSSMDVDIAQKFGLLLNNNSTGCGFEGAGASQRAPLLRAALEEGLIIIIIIPPPPMMLLNLRVGLRDQATCVTQDLLLQPKASTPSIPKLQTSRLVFGEDSLENPLSLNISAAAAAAVNVSITARLGTLQLTASSNDVQRGSTVGFYGSLLLHNNLTYTPPPDFAGSYSSLSASSSSCSLLAAKARKKRPLERLEVRFDGGGPLFVEVDITATNDAPLVTMLPEANVTRGAWVGVKAAMIVVTDVDAALLEMTITFAGMSLRVAAQGKSGLNVNEQEEGVLRLSGSPERLSEALGRHLELFWPVGVSTTNLLHFEVSDAGGCGSGPALTAHSTLLLRELRKQESSVTLVEIQEDSLPALLGTATGDVSATVEGEGSVVVFGDNLTYFEPSPRVFVLRLTEEQDVILKKQEWLVATRVRWRREVQYLTTVKGSASSSVRLTARHRDRTCDGDFSGGAVKAALLAMTDCLGPVDVVEEAGRFKLTFLQDDPLESFSATLLSCDDECAVSLQAVQKATTVPAVQRVTLRSNGTSLAGEFTLKYKQQLRKVSHNATAEEVSAALEAAGGGRVVVTRVAFNEPIPFNRDGCWCYGGCLNRSNATMAPTSAPTQDFNPTMRPELISPTLSPSFNSSAPTMMLPTTLEPTPAPSSAPTFAPRDCNFDPRETIWEVTFATESGEVDLVEAQGLSLQPEWPAEIAGLAGLSRKQLSTSEVQPGTRPLNAFFTISIDDQVAMMISTKATEEDFLRATRLLGVAKVEKTTPTHEGALEWRLQMTSRKHLEVVFHDLADRQDAGLEVYAEILARGETSNGVINLRAHHQDFFQDLQVDLGADVRGQISRGFLGSNVTVTSSTTRRALYAETTHRVELGGGWSRPWLSLLPTALPNNLRVSLVEEASTGSEGSMLALSTAPLTETVAEVQRLVCTSNNTASFKVGFRGRVSEPISFDSAPSSFEEQLDSFLSPHSSVTVEGDAMCSANVTFHGLEGDLPMLTVDSTHAYFEEVTRGSAPFVREVQRLYVMNTTTFTLGFRGWRTSLSAPLAADVEAALEALPSIADVNVTFENDAYTVTFGATRPHLGDLELLDCDECSLIEEIVKGAAPVWGEFRLKGEQDESPWIRVDGDVTKALSDFAGGEAEELIWDSEAALWSVAAPGRFVLETRLHGNLQIGRQGTSLRAKGLNSTVLFRPKRDSNYFTAGGLTRVALTTSSTALFDVSVSPVVDAPRITATRAYLKEEQLGPGLFTVVDVDGRRILRLELSLEKGSMVLGSRSRLLVEEQNATYMLLSGSPSSLTEALGTLTCTPEKSVVVLQREKQLVELKNNFATKTILALESGATGSARTMGNFTLELSCNYAEPSLALIVSEFCLSSASCNETMSSSVNETVRLETLQHDASQLEVESALQVALDDCSSQVYTKAVERGLLQANNETRRLEQSDVRASVWRSPEKESDGGFVWELTLLAEFPSSALRVLTSDGNPRGLRAVPLKENNVTYDASSMARPTLTLTTLLPQEAGVFAIQAGSKQTEDFPIGAAALTVEKGLRKIGVNVQVEKVDDAYILDFSDAVGPEELLLLVGDGVISRLVRGEATHATLSLRVFDDSATSEVYALDLYGSSSLETQGSYRLGVEGVARGFEDASIVNLFGSIILNIDCTPSCFLEPVHSTHGELVLPSVTKFDNVAALQAALRLARWDPAPDYAGVEHVRVIVNQQFVVSRTVFHAALNDAPRFVGFPSEEMRVGDLTTWTVGDIDGDILELTFSSAVDLPSSMLLSFNETSWRGTAAALNDALRRATFNQTTEVTLSDGQLSVNATLKFVAGEECVLTLTTRASTPREALFLEGGSLSGLVEIAAPLNNCTLERAPRLLLVPQGGAAEGKGDLRYFGTAGDVVVEQLAFSLALEATSRRPFVAARQLLEALESVEYHYEGLARVQLILQQTENQQPEAKQLWISQEAGGGSFCQVTLLQEVLLLNAQDDEALAQLEPLVTCSNDDELLDLEVELTWKEPFGDDDTLLMTFEGCRDCALHCSSDQDPMVGYHAAVQLRATASEATRALQAVRIRAQAGYCWRHAGHSRGARLRIVVGNTTQDVDLVFTPPPLTHEPLAISPGGNEKEALFSGLDLSQSKKQNCANSSSYEDEDPIIVITAHAEHGTLTLPSDIDKRVELMESDDSGSSTIKLRGPRFILLNLFKQQQAPL